MLAKGYKCTIFLSMSFIAVMHASRVGEPLVSPVNVVVDGGKHIFFYRGSKLNVTYNFGLLVLVNESGVGDIFCLRTLHSGFRLVVQPVKTEDHTWGLQSLLGMTRNRTKRLNFYILGAPIRTLCVVQTPQSKIGI